MKVLAANGLARILKAEGTPWVATFPVCCVNNALGQEGVPLYMMRDERYAVALADAYSRVTGGRRIGVCTVMGGMNAAGLQMAYGALAQAYEDSSPVLCITDGLPAGSGGRLRYDITEGVRAVTKWIGHIDQPQRVPEVMRRAYTALRSGRPGPVVVTVPRGLGEYDDAEHPYRPVQGWRSAPDPADVTAAVTALVAAKRPLLYVGEGALYAEATAALCRFAERIQAPVLTTLKAKSAFPESHPLSLGVRGEPAIDFLRRSDLVFGIGTSLALGHFRHTIPSAYDKTILQCTNDVEDVNRNYRVDVALVGDAQLALEMLTAELAQRTGGDVVPNHALHEEIRTAKAAMMATYRPLMASNETPINPYRVYGELSRVLDPRRSFLTHDSGTTRDQLTTVYETDTPRGFMGWGNVSTLGFGLAAAMAAKLAHPEWQCVNVTGDAGVGYMLGNLEALVRYSIGVTTIHINNGGFAGYGPGFWGPGHDPYTCEVCDPSRIHWAEVVRAMGYHAERVTEPALIAPALRRALEANAEGQPAYVEVICSQYPVFGAWSTG
ncbi:MAG TPA: hypothetical protein GX714_07755 [Chloroflexi bacterium]|jgi:acetolactate synthase-1/2/3 large subunit|nr:hypothetical protein [Chloroflexota bacterium]